MSPLLRSACIAIVLASPCLAAAAPARLSAVTMRSAIAAHQNSDSILLSRTAPGFIAAQNAAAANPADAGGQNRLGMAFAGNLGPEKAIAKFSEAIALDSSRWEYYSNRAAVYLRQKQPDLALIDINHALAVSPDNATLLAQRAIAQGRLGHAELTSGDLAKARSLDPLNPYLGSAQVDLWIAATVRQKTGKTPVRRVGSSGALTVDSHLLAMRQQIVRLDAELDLEQAKQNGSSPSTAHLTRNPVYEPRCFADPQALGCKPWVVSEN